MNSFVLILFLLGVVSTILFNTLKKDISRYHPSNDFDLDPEQINYPSSTSSNSPTKYEFGYEEEYGWKLIHGDVFRTPTFLTFLSSFYGTGVQMLVLIVLIIVSQCIEGAQIMYILSGSLND